MKISLNGTLVDEADARISVFDRGFLFGDGIYELVRYFAGVGVGVDAHTARLARSLGLARISGFDASRLDAICRETLAANGLRDGVVYLQITRGAAATRAHVPTAAMQPTVVAIATAAEPLESLVAPLEIAAITAADQRWQRCEIKTISLMGNILHLLAADDAGAQEAILHRDGFVGEGAYSNVALVKDGVLVTSPIESGPPILHGTARLDLLDAARALGVACEVRPITLDELRAADEILITSSRRLASAIVRLDGAAIGDGRAGPCTTRLFVQMRRAIEALLATHAHHRAANAPGTAAHAVPLPA